MSVLDKAKKLNKEFQNNNFAIMASVAPKYERFSTGALGVDFILYGGLPLGRMCVFAGLEHSGKTTAAMLELSAYQRAFPDKTCVFVDVEHSLDMEFQSAMTGVDLTKLLYLNPENMSGEQILAVVEELQEEDDIGMIVIDSIAALVSSRDYDTSVEEDKGMAAGIAKPLAKFIKKMVDKVSMKKNVLLLINQVREVGKTFTGATIYGEPCGHAPKYYASVKVRFGTRTFTKGDKVDLSDGEEADGFRLKFKVTKNKTLFPLYNIHEHQLLHIRRIIKHHGISFLIIYMNNTYYLLPGEKLISFIDNNTTKSIPYEYIKNNSYVIKLGYNPYLDYIKAIDLMIKENGYEKN